ncbi:hypothetical protein ACWDNI_35770 [Nocardia niigatensis]
MTNRDLITDGFRKHAALESIEAHLTDQRRARARLDRVITRLEDLATERRAQIAAGTWPPRKVTESNG